MTVDRLTERDQLRARQHAVLDDLLAGRTPPDFEPRGTAMTTRVLHHKRSSAALHVAPELAELDGWRPLFHAWAGSHPLQGCAHDDVRAFVATLPATAADWVRLHEVYDGRRRAAFVRVRGGRALVVGLGRRVWRWGCQPEKGAGR